MIELIDSTTFFKEKLHTYFEENKIPVDKDILTYLVGVLNTYLYSDTIKDKTLFEIYKKCIINNKIEDYTKLGEQSLYISGMFPASISKSLVNINYYINMGKIGFSQASSLSFSKSSKTIYKNVSYNFKHYMNSFYIISKDSIFKDKLSMYEQYLQTENPAILRNILNLHNFKN